MRSTVSRAWSVVVSGVLVAAATTAISLAGVSSAGAAPGTDASAPVVHDRVVSDVPAAFTPQIRDGRVLGIAQVGTSMVVGGTFTQVSAANGSGLVTRQRAVSFNAANGAINPFNPTVNGDVNAVFPGPTAGTVYVAGSFTTVNGVTTRVALLDAVSGATVGTFRAPAMNGVVQDVVKLGNRLYLGGNFTAVGNVEHRGLVTLNASSGALDPFMGVDVSVNHNWTTGSTGARAAVGVSSIAIAPNGQRLVAIGNFKVADGSTRDQVVLVNIGGAVAQVAPDWRTTRYEPSCFAGAFDSYVRDIDFAPDGSYFAIVATGGPNPGTLCDTVARFDTSTTGQAVEPVWVDDTGGDTLFSVTSTGAAVYTGGHQRWMNNAGGQDQPAPGAIPRPGIAAVHPTSGVALSWNPGRNPRGVGAFALQPTAAGLWVGSDTNYIGNFEFWRPRLAFFPLTGGTQVPPGATTQLPANVYLGSPGATATGTSNAILRVNAGGPELPAADGGPDWLADNGADSPLRNSGSNASGWGPVPSVDASVPTSTPPEVFDSERWDPAGAPEMSWNLPVTAGQQVQVRLYFANRCSCTATAGQRSFDVSVEGVTRLSNYDIVADVGHNVGTMKAYDVTSDGTIDIDLVHRVENPLINGIEIVRPGPTTPPPAASNILTRRFFTGTTASAASAAPAGGLAWSNVRAATTIDGELWYGLTDGTFHRRTFDGTSYGPDRPVDPYNDPEWSNVQTGSGQTYQGQRPPFYSQLATTTGLAFRAGQLYSTRGGVLTARGFTPESGVVSGVSRTVASIPGIGGIFFSGANLWYSDTTTGALSRVAFTGGAPAGAPTVVSGPSVDGVDWRSRTLFTGPGPQPGPVNQAPTAAIAPPTCVAGACSFDGTGSTDPDGTVVSYAWNFGDGATATGPTPSHSYEVSGPYTVTLTVTDNSAATGTTTRNLTVTVPVAEGISFVGVDGAQAAAGTSATVTVPAGAQVGDALLIYATVNNNLAGTVATPAGWTMERVQGSQSMQTALFSRTAQAGDPGSDVAVRVSASAKLDVQLAAYRGTSSVDPTRVVASRADGAGPARTSPVVTVQAGDWGVTHWADKSSSTTDWSAPSGTVVRGEQFGTGPGRVSSLLVDADAPLASGTYGGLVASTNIAGARSTIFTVVLAAP